MKKKKKKSAHIIFQINFIQIAEMVAQRFPIQGGAKGRGCSLTSDYNQWCTSEVRKSLLSPPPVVGSLPGELKVP